MGTEEGDEEGEALQPSHLGLENMRYGQTIAA